MNNRLKNCQITEALVSEVVKLKPCAITFVSALFLGSCGVDNSNGVGSSSSSSSSNSSSSSSSSSSTTSGGLGSELSFVYAINSGGESATVNGLDYQADRFFRGGTEGSTSSSIAGVDDDTIYRSERFGRVTYEIPVTNSSYSLNLNFVEMYHSAAGDRLFDVSVEGVSVAGSLDVYQEVGDLAAYELSVPQIRVLDESLTIELETVLDNATISGFSIYSDDGGEFVEPPIPEPGESVLSSGCGSTRSSADGQTSINVDGTNRSYILRVPSGYNNQNPYRLVIAYHWLSGNANQVANGGMGGSTDDPFYGLWDLANNSTIFVAPEGIDNGWANSGGRDIRFTDEILQAVKSDLCIDETRVFATGFSYGAGMSNAIACARADEFRGVALYAGAQLSGCDGGSKPIAYFGAHGMSDSVLNISQGRGLRDRFAANNNCTAMSPPEPAGGSGSHLCTSYTGCDEGYPVRWCAFDGDHNPTEKDRGQSKSWIPGEAWTFISQF